MSCHVMRIIAVHHDTWDMKRLSTCSSCLAYVAIVLSSALCSCSLARSFGEFTVKLALDRSDVPSTTVFRRSTRVSIEQDHLDVPWPGNPNGHACPTGTGIPSEHGLAQRRQRWYCKICKLLILVVWIFCMLLDTQSGTQTWVLHSSKHDCCCGLSSSRPAWLHVRPSQACYQSSSAAA